MSHWIPLIATSVGVTLGALLSFVAQWLHFRRQRSAESRTLRLTKLEELYGVLTDIRQHYIELHTKYTNRLLLPAAVRPDDANDKTPIPFARMQMLTTIYARSL